MRQLLVRASDCSGTTLLRIAKRAGFACDGGKKHWKITTSTGVFVTTIPRHEQLKRETVKGVVERMNEFGAQIVVR